MTESSVASLSAGSREGLLALSHTIAPAQAEVAFGTLGLVPRIQRFEDAGRADGWMVGTSPTMTKGWLALEGEHRMHSFPGVRTEPDAFAHFDIAGAEYIMSFPFTGR